MVICLERGASDLHMVQLMPLPPHHLLLQQNPERFILLVPAYPGCPGKKAVKRLCVCACVLILIQFHVGLNSPPTPTEITFLPPISAKICFYLHSMPAYLAVKWHNMDSTQLQQKFNSKSVNDNRIATSIKCSKSIHLKILSKDSLFTAHALIAMALCLCVSVCHKSEFSINTAKLCKQ